MIAFFMNRNKRWRNRSCSSIRHVCRTAALPKWCCCTYPPPKGFLRRWSWQHSIWVSPYCAVATSTFRWACWITWRRRRMLDSLPQLRVWWTLAVCSIWTPLSVTPKQRVRSPKTSASRVCSHKIYIYTRLCSGNLYIEYPAYNLLTF